MQIEAQVQAIREDLARMAALGDDSTVQAAELLAAALEPSLARRLQEALAEAALELSAQMEDGRVEVRIVGGDPELVHVPVASAAQAADAAEEVFSARVTLRLSDGLKSRLEESAAAGGVSLNTWIVRTLTRAVEPRGSRDPNRHRLTGYGRS